MYKSDKNWAGDVEILTIGKDNGPRLEVMPAKGAAIFQIYLGDESVPILNPFEDQDDIDMNPVFKNAILFPFPNRLKDGLYTYGNTNYAFPVNEPERNNALHGLVYNKEFVLTELDLNEESASVELTYIYHGQEEAYPFPFTLRIRYGISSEGFTMTTKVENTGFSKLPYGFGWHPYFKTDTTNRLWTQAANMQVVNERMLPTGEEKLHSFGEEIGNISDNLDNAFRIPENDQFETVIGDFSGKLIEIKADAGFRFFQIYNPQENIVAIEPVTSNINALNTGDELIELEKGVSREYKISISLK